MTYPSGATGSARVLAGKRGLSLAQLFATLSIVVCLAATALCIVDLTHARGEAVGVARREVENLSKGLAAQVTDTLDATDSALSTVVRSVERTGVGPAQRRQLNAVLAALIATLPRLHDISVIDERGRFVVTNASSDPTGLRIIADRPDFRYHHDHRDGRLYISGPARAKSDGQWVLFVSRRVDRPDGSFGGIVVAPIRLEYFSQIFAGIDIGASGAIALALDDGTLVTRRPALVVGTTIRSAEMFADRFARFRGGSYIGASPVDGVRRLYAFERISRYPVILEAGVAEDEYLAAWRRDALANYLALGLGTALLGALAGGLGGQITRRQRAEGALALLNVDTLTGLANRRRFEDELERAWRAGAEAHAPVALLIVEIANLKAYNDGFGHQQGDALLMDIARTLAETVSPSALAARYSGLEFAAIVPATNEAQAIIIADRVERVIATLITAKSRSGRTLVGITIGTAALVPQGSVRPAVLVGAAFVALHNSKREHAGDSRELLPDAVTGLANRRRFDSELESIWRDAARSGAPVGLLIVAIANLKAYNDRYGHEAGDDLLTSVAQTVAASVIEAGSLAARYSGLELAVILPGLDTAAVIAVAARVQLALGGLFVQRTPLPGIMVAVDLGFTSRIPDTPDDAATLVGAAFVALHDAKRDANDTASPRGLTPAPGTATEACTERTRGVK